MDEEVYVTQPAGIASSSTLSEVLRLHKALYGLHQALRAWNTKLDSVLVTLGITRSPSEHDLYTCGEDVEQLLLGVYVDDLIPIGACTNIISKFKEKMSCKFCTCDLGLLKLYLGIEVKQAPQVITLKQAVFVGKLLEKARTTGCNADGATSQVVQGELQCTNGHLLYRTNVGSLRYPVQIGRAHV